MDTGQWCGDGLWKWVMGCKGEQRGKNWDDCDSGNTKIFKLKIRK